MDHSHNSNKIDHYERAGKAWPILIQCAQQKRTITYGELAKTMGLHHRACRYFLGRIQDFCMAHALPPLQSLVVNKFSGKPGHGYIATPRDGLDSIHENVFRFQWDRVENPFGASPTYMRSTSVNSTELATLIQETIQDGFQDWPSWEITKRDSSRHWTQKLKAIMKELGCRLGYDVRMSEKGDTNWEFLYDVCFLETKDVNANHDGYFRPDNYIIRSVLALECEWSTQLDEILYDFSKLLLTRGILKVMVCYQASSKGVQNVLHTLQNAIECYAQTTVEDHYLLCICDWSGKAFQFYLLNGCGILDRVAFS